MPESVTFCVQVFKSTGAYDLQPINNTHGGFITFLEKVSLPISFGQYKTLSYLMIVPMCRVWRVVWKKEGLYMKVTLTRNSMTHTVYT